MQDSAHTATPIARRVHWRSTSDVETLLLAHDLAAGLILEKAEQREGMVILGTKVLRYRWRLLARGKRVGILLADPSGASGTVANHVLELLGHVFRTSLAGVDPECVDAIVHLGHRDFGIARLRRSQQPDLRQTVNPYGWHHFRVADVVTDDEETI